MRKFIITTLIVVTIIFSISGYRVSTHYADHQVPVSQKVSRINVDNLAVAERLSQAIKIKTLSTEDGRETDKKSISQFHKILEVYYPRISEYATRTKINGESLVYKFPGSNSGLMPALFMGHMDVAQMLHIFMSYRRIFIAFR